MYIHVDNKAVQLFYVGLIKSFGACFKMRQREGDEECAQRTSKVNVWQFLPHLPWRLRFHQRRNKAHFLLPYQKSVSTLNNWVSNRIFQKKQFIISSPQQSTAFTNTELHHMIHSSLRKLIAKWLKLKQLVCLSGVSALSGGSYEVNKKLLLVCFVKIWLSLTQEVFRLLVSTQCMSVCSQVSSPTAALDFSYSSQVK